MADAQPMTYNSVDEFANAIKTKFPQYKDWPNQHLAAEVMRKYPKAYAVQGFDLAKYDKEKGTDSSYVGEVARGVGRAAKGMTWDIGVYTAEHFRDPGGPIEAFGKDFYKGLAAGKEARDKAKEQGDNWAGQVLATLEQYPLIGGMVQKAEEGGPHMFSPQSLGAAAEGITYTAGPKVAKEGLVKVGDLAVSKLPPVLRQKAAELNTKVFKQADAGKVDYHTSAALQVANEHIWGTVKSLPEKIEKARLAKDAEVTQRAAQLDRNGVTINVAQDIHPTLNKLMQRLNAQGLFTPEVRTAITNFMQKRILTKFDPRTGQWVPRNLGAMKVGEALEISKGLEDLSGFDKHGQITEIQSAARSIREAVNDRVGKADPEIQRLRSEESKLITDRQAARDLREKMLNDKLSTMRGIISSGKIPAIAAWIALKSMGLGWGASLGSVLAIKALAESAPSRTLRASLYVRAADMLDAQARAASGITGASGAAGAGSAITRPNAPVTGGNTGVTPPARQLGTSAPFAEAQVVFTNPPSAPSWSPGKTTQGLPESATRARSGSGNYVTPERQAAAEAKANKPGFSPMAQAQEELRRSAAQSNTKSAPAAPPTTAAAKAAPHDYKALLSDALARRGSTKSGWETQSLEKQIAELTRAASGKATKEELKVINQHITARQRAAGQRAASASQAPTGAGVSAASGTSGGTGEAVSSAMSPEQRAVLLEQGYKKLESYENGKMYVKALRDNAKLLSKDPTFDEVEALTGALEALRQLEGK